jgi:hypothetical protein
MKRTLIYLSRGPNSIAASDLLHAAIISANRDCPTAMASVAALVTVVAISVAALTPIWAASVNAYTARTDVHALS